MGDFIVYRRSGDQVVPHRARLVERGWTGPQADDGVRWQGAENEAWVILDIDVGQPVSWAELYAGHTAWIGEQIGRHRDAVKRARAERAVRKDATVLNKGAV